MDGPHLIAGVIPQHTNEFATIAKTAHEALLRNLGRTIYPQAGAEVLFSLGRIGHHDVVIACLPKEAISPYKDQIPDDVTEHV